MPARWPSTRGRWRLAAHRPLPSMMMATWRGSRSKSMRRTSASSADPAGTAASMSARAMASGQNLTPLRLGPATAGPYSGQAVPVRPCDRRHVQYATSTSVRPEAGAVWPAARRSRERKGSGRPVRRPNAAADIHERAHDDANHVAQEPVAVDLDHDFAGRVARRQGASSVRTCRAWRVPAFERSEVVAADQARRRRAHQGRRRTVAAYARQSARSNGDRIRVVEMR